MARTGGPNDDDPTGETMNILFTHKQIIDDYAPYMRRLIYTSNSKFTREFEKSLSKECLGYSLYRNSISLTSRCATSITS